MNNIKALLKYLKEYWLIITMVLGGIGAASIIPYRLDAMENRQDDFEETQKNLVAQTTMIAEYVKGQETEKSHEKELQASAPPGYRWDSNTRAYIKK